MSSLPAMPSVSQEIIDLDLAQFCDHILDTHHAYIREQGPVILDLLSQLAFENEESTQIKNIQNTFIGLFQELIQHLPKEEQVLFPMCKQIEAAVTPVSLHCGSLIQPIGAMEYEHELTVEHLAKVRKASGEYILPSGAEAEMKKLYSLLKAFDEDLVIHMHKENNLLFPRALAQERFLGQQT